MDFLLILSILIIAVNIAVIGLGFWIGYRRGAGRSAVRLIYILIISFIAYFLAIALSRPLSGAILSAIQPHYNETLRQLAENSPFFEQLIRGLIASVLAPLFLPLIFVIFQALSMIKFRFIADKLVSVVKKDGDPMNKTSKWIGAGVGILCGIIVSTVLLAPLSLAVVILDSVDEETLAVFSLSKTGTEKLESAGGFALANQNPHSLTASRPVVLASDSFSFSGFFGKFLAESLTSLDGYDTSLSAEVPVLLNAAGSAYSAYQNKISAGASPSEAALGAISTLVSYMDDSEMLPEITAQLLNSAGTAWSNGEEFLGMSFDTSDPVSGQLLSAFIDTLKNTTPDNVAENLNTLVGAEEGSDSVLGSLMSLKDEGISLKSPDSLAVMADVLIEIGKNENMSPIIDMVGQLGSDLIKEAGITTIPADESGVYEKFKDQLVATVNSSAELDYESRVNSLASSIVSTAASYNYTISMPEAKLLAISLLAYFGSEENITVEGLMDYFGVTEKDVAAAGK